MSEREFSDEDLYARIKRAGDLAAFDTLYERHKGSLFQFIGRYVEDRGEAEDVFHEAFLRVLRPRASAGDCDAEVDFSKGSFRGWLFMVARNLCRNRQRSERRGRRAVATLLSGSPETTSPSAESLLGEHESLTRLREAGERLPAPFAEIYRRRIAGEEQAQIAQALGIPVGTVKSRLHFLTKLLKSKLLKSEMNS